MNLRRLGSSRQVNPSETIIEKKTTTVEVDLRPRQLATD